MDGSELPDLSKPRYDQSTFAGRFRHFLNVIDPRTLFTTDAQLLASKRIIDEYKQSKKLPQGGTEALWAAQTQIEAAIHPATKQKIPAFFRMAAFVPANVAIAAGLVWPGTGMKSQVFWQIVNQSYNTAMNYANRNGTDADPTTQEVATNYGLAVISSCGLALGCNAAFQRATFLSESARKFGRLFVPFIAVAGANLANVVLMRSGELKHGIEVFDDEGVVRGKSEVAAQYGLAQVALSRVVIPIPVLTIPPLAFYFLNKVPSVTKHPIISAGLNLTLITACLSIGLPTAIALFPQVGSISTSKLEQEFRQFTDSKGKPIESLYFNKGL